MKDSGYSKRPHDRLAPDAPGETALDALSAAGITERLVAGTATENDPPRGALAQPVTRVMNAPLVTCPAHWALRQCLKTMRDRDIGSLGVVNTTGKVVGIVTMTTLAEATLLHGHGADAPVTEACTPLVSVEPEMTLWQAEALQKRTGTKYLVVAEDGRPVGMVSQTNILHALLAQPGALLDRVNRADSLARLRAIRDEVGSVAREAWEHNRNTGRALRVINDFHLSIQRRCVELTLEGMAEADTKSPPRPYALIIMGSGGRREMLINPDQDNGIIIDDNQGRMPLQDGERHWFQEFTEQLNRNLDTVGYVLCPGRIMAGTPAYHRTLRDWQHLLDTHVHFPGEAAARWAGIVLDFDILYGDTRLTRALWSHALDSLSRHPRLLEFMARDDAQGRPALGLFNRLITADDRKHRGKVDVKRQGLRLICDAARILALHAGISETGTVDRLRALVRQGALTEGFAAAVIAAHDEFMDLLLEHQLSQQENGEEPDKLIPVAPLVPLRRERLRLAMHAVKRFQDLLQSRFGP